LMLNTILLAVEAPPPKKIVRHNGII
jgi:hypothetical protein